MESPTKKRKTTTSEKEENLWKYEGEDWVVERQYHLREWLGNNCMKYLPVQPVNEIIVNYCHGWVWIVTASAADQEFWLDPLELKDSCDSGHTVLDLIPVSRYADSKELLFQGLYRIKAQYWIKEKEELTYFDFPIYWKDLGIKEIEWNMTEQISNESQSGSDDDFDTDIPESKSVWEMRQVSKTIKRSLLHPFQLIGNQMWMNHQPAQEPTIFNQDYPKAIADWQDIGSEWYSKKDQYRYDSAGPKAYLYDAYCISLDQRSSDSLRFSSPTTRSNDGFCHTINSNLSHSDSYIQLTLLPKCNVTRNQSKRPRTYSRYKIMDCFQWCVTGDSSYFRFPSIGIYKISVDRNTLPNMTDPSITCLVTLPNIRLSKEHLVSTWSLTEANLYSCIISIANVADLLGQIELSVTLPAQHPSLDIVVTIERISDLQSSFSLSVKK